MMLAVQLAAACMNFHLYDFRELLIWFCWIPFFTLPYYLTQKKTLYRIIVVLFFVEGLISLAHWILLKGPVTASSIFIFLNTNFSEASEFLSLKCTFRFLWLVPYVFFFVLALLKPPQITSIRYDKYVVGIVFLFAAIFFADNIIHKRFVRKAVPQTERAFISFFEEAKSYKLLKERVIMPVEAILDAPKENKYVFVLIIGESANRNHMSLYGYSRKTTPRLEKRHDIIVYENVVSHYSHTINAVLSMMTESDAENKKHFDESISLNDVFYHAGFKTFWISNQLPVGIWDNAVYNLAQTFQTTFYTNNAANSSFESTYYSPYDEILFQPLSIALNDTAKHKFIVLHLMGSHSSYAKRYPKEYQCFTSAANAKENTINQYDNSVLYNDFVVDSLLSIISIYSKETQDIVSAIYLSDHGENVYDENNDVGHGYSGIMPKSIVEIPFMVWLSSSYREHFAEKSHTIRQRRLLPFMSDHLFEAIIDLNFVHYPDFLPQKSIFHDTYNSQRKRVLEDNTDYDVRYQHLQ
jgi:heptose-I-phosphate ethanolaminephosphotransferase